MAEHHDIVVLGLGTCGEDLALRLLDGGMDVAGIEPELVGGECAYWACIPSKMMIRAGNSIAEARRVNALAGSSNVRPDWGRVASRVRDEATGGWDDSVAVERFRARGGMLFRGYGRLLGENRVLVGDVTLEARVGIVIATGSRPVVPPIPGLDETGFWTTHDAIQAAALPASLIVLGGGAVGCELGQVFARFGTDVTIVEGRERLLAAEEPEASQVVEAALAADGVTARLGVHAARVSGAPGSIEVGLTDGSSISAEVVLLATGRHVDVSQLGLENAGIGATERGFIAVDARQRAAPGMWAIGDVTGKGMFTHMALHQSAIVAADLLGEPFPEAPNNALPRITFTDPEVGAVGLTEAQARESGARVTAVVKQLPRTFRGWLHGPGGSGVLKLIVDEADGTLHGATAAGPHGGEVLGLLSAAVQLQLTVDQLRSLIYPYPSFHGAIGEALGAHGRGIGTVIDPDFVPYTHRPRSPV